MILVDTSVWIAHFRAANHELVASLTEGQVLTHACVIGEIACGGQRQRQEILSLLPHLPQAKMALDSEVLALIDDYELYGKGIGWIDAHLLASCLLSRSALWTLDKKLSRLARVVGI
jgi:hypothetical protein